MQTHPQCLPCFHRQARYAANLATSDPTLQETILDQVAEFLSGLDLMESPPVNSMGLYGIVSRLAKNPDPFASLKRQSNDLGLSLRPQVEAMIHQGDDPLRRAILFAIAGNIIDYGSQQHFDLDATLRHCLQVMPVIDEYERLRRELNRAQTVLYLADNCGEIVFDGLLIDQLPGEVTMAVKAGPIINDATVEDALACGLEQKCRVISNGTSCPGTPLKQCSEEFQELFEKADVVISKGQGNFETLSESRRPIFHLLTIKCPVVASHAAEVSGRSGPLPMGSAVVLRLGEQKEG